MTEPTGFDRTLADWLDDMGAQDAPPRLKTAAIDRARQTRRARPLPDFLTRWLPMNTTLVLRQPIPLGRPQTIARIGPMAVIIALVLLALALIGLALLAVGTSPLPVVPRNGLIAFDSDGDIKVTEADGSALKNLTEGTQSEAQPAWSPDGTRLVYRVTTGGTGEVVIMGADGTVQRTVTDVDGFPVPYAGMAVWSSDGRTIAVKASMTDGAKMMLIDADTGVGQIIDLGLPIGLPRWSPDASLIAFDSGGDAANTVFVAAPDGSGRMPISAGWAWAALDDAPYGTFTPDGRSVVIYGRSATGTEHDIALTAVDGSGARTLVGGPTDDIYPSVSPDGRLIAFQRTASGGDAGLYVVPIGGGEPERVASDVELGGFSVVWSPDSTKLAVPTPASDQLVLLSVDGSSALATIPTPNNVGYASWQAQPG